MKTSPKWLKLKLRSDREMASFYVIIHTHYSIYQHLAEQGYDISFYEMNNKRKEKNPVIYIKTNHEGFLESCRKYYGHHFDISSPNENFKLPKGYKLMLGGEAVAPAMV